MKLAGTKHVNHCHYFALLRHFYLLSMFNLPPENIDKEVRAVFQPIEEVFPGKGMSSTCFGQTKCHLTSAELPELTAIMGSWINVSDAAWRMGLPGQAEVGMNSVASFVHQPRQT
jgi:hypothetical protein